MGSFMSESQVWESNENFILHARHRYRFSYRLKTQTLKIQTLISCWM